MEEGDEAEHGPHTAPFAACEAFAQRNPLGGLHNYVHGAPCLDANDLQVERVNHARWVVNLKSACHGQARRAGV